MMGGMDTETETTAIMGITARPEVADVAGVATTGQRDDMGGMQPVKGRAQLDGIGFHSAHCRRPFAGNKHDPRGAVGWSVRSRHKADPEAADRQVAADCRPR